MAITGRPEHEIKHEERKRLEAQRKSAPKNKLTETEKAARNETLIKQFISEIYKATDLERGKVRANRLLDSMILQKPNEKSLYIKCFSAAVRRLEGDENAN